MRMGTLVHCGVLALGAALVAASRADMVYLHDGRIFEGAAVRAPDGSVSVDTMIGRIRTTLRFARAEVARIEDRALAEGFFDAPASEARPEASIDIDRVPRDTRTRDATYYLEAPVRGVFGHDVLPKAIEETLEFAARRKIEHVVFLIDSPGGEVWAADAIAATLERFEDRVTCYAVVERAMSAAIWVAFSCERIYVAPSSAMGAAVVFQRDETTGDAAVDEKLTSAYAAILGGIAEQRGRPAAIARAMVNPEAELYTWLDEHGERHFAGEPPQQSDYETLDTLTGVLTLTGEEMLRLGIANGRASGGADIGELTGLPGWKQPIAFGTATAKRYAELARESRRAIDACGESIEQSRKVADQRHPERGSYSYTPKGEFTDFGRQQWVRRVDECGAAWRRVWNDSNDLGRALADAEEAGLPLDYESLCRRQKEWKDEASRHLELMKILRRRTGR